MSFNSGSRTSGILSEASDPFEQYKFLTTTTKRLELLSLKYHTWRNWTTPVEI